MASYCYLTYLINKHAIKFKKQKHSNCLKCPPSDSMHFSPYISSDWVALAMVSGWFHTCSTKENVSVGFVLTFILYTKLSKWPQRRYQEGYSLATSVAMSQAWHDPSNDLESTGVNTPLHVDCSTGELHYSTLQGCHTYFQHNQQTHFLETCIVLTSTTAQLWNGACLLLLKLTRGIFPTSLAGTPWYTPHSTRACVCKHTSIKTITQYIFSPHFTGFMGLYVLKNTLPMNDTELSSTATMVWCE
jgi:hypothetical protein